MVGMRDEGMPESGLSAMSMSFDMALRDLNLNLPDWVYKQAQNLDGANQLRIKAMKIAVCCDCETPLKEAMSKGCETCKEFRPLCF